MRGWGGGGDSGRRGDEVILRVSELVKLVQSRSLYLLVHKLQVSFLSGMRNRVCTVPTNTALNILLWLFALAQMSQSCKPYCLQIC